ncbi:Nucleotide-binding universal stress protein, UspA family [Mucilaginibacter mallensis]|uniref:Nucleotide-binding universal stress protein, UspA family n=1 Tax=Mucilaginibacter mallensis TaxID=652787 RepID=A0A1H1NW20_MUCMA|nr:universal stress protein [Mucilaginibacter mallensis]SDS03178.1 Nucleotide-binding universal stress protein, UspA family [Mucilaginibacter mallensis]
MIKKILIGIDDSAYAEHAAKYGFNLAETLNTHVGLVHMTEPVSLAMTNTGADEILGTSMQALSGPDNLELLKVQDEIAENLMERIVKKYGGTLQVTHFNEFGSTGEGIINCSHEFKADLIIIGTHRRTGLDRLLMGSIAEYVVRHSEIPVLVVPSKE